MAEKYLISIVGPTAIGKTALSIALAQHYATHIISTDSRQFYKEMRIGTAVPNTEELQTAQHHFIQHISIHETYTVGQFEKEAIDTLNTLYQTQDIVVMVGGSGLFHKAVVEGLDDFPDVNPSIRTKLNQQLKEKGIEVLQAMLQQHDPESYRHIDINNHQRVIRALEISIGTGVPFSNYKTQAKKSRSFKVITIGLTAERELIYSRINQRVDLMISEGLEDEALALYSQKHLNALNTVGYKELFECFDGTLSLSEAIDKIKMNTRRFAKRQLTWFRKDKRIKWFTYPYDVSKIIEYIDESRASQLKRNDL